MTKNSRGPEMDSNPVDPVEPRKDVWEKPEVFSYAPAKHAQGISYNPTDGISNLTP